jgi:hypothetical protein
MCPGCGSEKEFARNLFTKGFHLVRVTAPKAATFDNVLTLPLKPNEQARERAASRK